VTADERDLTPEEEAELTRLLADAGGPAPTPPEVAARLDDVLAGLVADRAAGAPAAGADESPRAADPADPGPGAAVVPLEARRRRWPKALLAAAAVVAGGYGIGAALTGTTMSGDSDSSVTADESAAGGAESAGSGESGDSAAGGEAEGQAMQSRPRRDAMAEQAPANVSQLREPPPLLRPDRLAEDVGRLLERAERRTAAELGSPLPATQRGAAATCLPRTLGPDDTWFLVRYDGRRAALVTSPPADGTVQATVLGCDGDRLDAVTVPAP
jgi:hypothetical protein